MKARASHTFEKEHHEFYLEPKWCPRAILQAVRPTGEIYDPFAGTGRQLLAAEELGYLTRGSEITAEGWRDKHCAGPIEYGVDSLNSPSPEAVDNLLSNPPYGPTKRVVETWLPRVQGDTMLLLPSDWFWSETRREWLEATPLVGVYALVPRPSMPPGDMALDHERKTGKSPTGGTKNFAYYHWQTGRTYNPKLYLLSANAECQRILVDPFS